MTAFIALLSSYYLCDAAAALHPLAPDTAQACAARYEAVKDTFVDETAAGPEARRLAYMRFKRWEAENADLVADLRRDAHSQASDLIATWRYGDAI